MKIEYTSPTFLISVIALGAIITYIGIRLNHKISPFIRNITVGFILAILAIDLIPKIVGQNKSEVKLISLLGLLIGAVLVLVFSTKLNNGNERNILEVIMVAFIFGIIFSLSTPANIILGLILGSIIVMSLVSVGSYVLGALTIIFAVVAILIGYQIGSHYGGTLFYYFSISMAIAILIWILISRLLTTNQDINKTQISQVALIVFLGFVIGWLIQ